MGPKFHSPRLGKLGDTHDRLNHVLPGQGHESDTSGAPAHWAWHTGLSPRSTPGIYYAGINES